MASPNLNHLPKAPPPDTITLEIRASLYDLGEQGHMDIQSIAVPKLISLCEAHAPRPAE